MPPIIGFYLEFLSAEIDEPRIDASLPGMFFTSCLSCQGYSRHERSEGKHEKKKCCVRSLIYHFYFLSFRFSVVKFKLCSSYMLSFQSMLTQTLITNMLL